MAAHISHGRHHFSCGEFTFGYTVRGHGPLLVVQCPAWGIGSKYLERTLVELQQHFTTLHFEPRGTGRSTRPKDETKMSVFDMAEDLELLRRGIGVEKMSLLGHSNGGSIALAYAQLFSQRVDKLLLVASRLVGYDDTAAWRDRGDLSYDEAYMRLEDMKPTSDEEFGQYLREFIPAYFYDPVESLPSFLKTLKDNPCAWCLEHNFACDRAVGSRLIDGLYKVTAEAIIVAGRHDLLTRLPEAEAMKAGIGDNAEIVVLEECGHFPWLEKPEEFLSLALEFLKGHGAEGTGNFLSRMSISEGEDRPIGPRVDTTPADRPSHMIIEGRSITLEPLRPTHANALFEAVGGIERAALWDYMPDGPFTDQKVFRDYITRKSQSDGPLFFAVLDKSTNKPIGHASFLRIDPCNRSIEVGSIMFSPLLQRTTAATECMYLMARTAFDRLGYRRYEWKCNNLNAPSKRAAERLGFTFEGVFRQHMITKGRNRDTAWFSMLDYEWLEVKRGFEAWLDPENFDELGNQKQSLIELRTGMSWPG